MNWLVVLIVLAPFIAFAVAFVLIYIAEDVTEKPHPDPSQ